MANPIKVLTPDNVESIYDLEMERLASIESDEMQRNLISWESPWRKESLNHYKLPRPYNFLGRNNQPLFVWS